MRRLFGLVCAVLCVFGLSTVAGTATAQAASHRSPGKIHGLHAVSHSSVSVNLSWTLPKAAAFRSTIVRYATGTHAPKTVRSGHSAAHLGRRAHTLTLSALRSGQPYAISVFALDKGGHAGPRVSTVVAVAPAPVTDVRSFALPAATQVTWVNPKTRTFARVVVRLAKGAAAPTTPSRGRGIRVPGARATTAPVTGLARNTTYALSVWALDRKGGYSTPTVTRFTTSAGADANGTVVGTVTDTAQAPLAAVQVEAYGDSGEDLTTETNVGGHFALSLPADHYTLFVGGDEITGGNSPDTGYVGTTGDAVARSGRTTTLTAIALEPGAAITGTLVDSGGNAVAGAYPYAVSVTPFVHTDSDATYYSFGGSLGGQRSAADGTFTLRGVPTDGAVRVCAQPTDAGHSAACSQHTVLGRAASTSSAGTLVLPALAGGTVTGTVRSSSGAGVDGAQVFLRGTGSQSTLFLNGVTGSHGDYSIHAVPPGVYQACAQSTTVTSGHPTGLASACTTKTVQVTGGVTSRLNVTLPVGAAVTGTVTGPTGRPVAQVDVSVENSTTGGYTRTNSHGQYTVTGLLAGSVQVCFGTDSASGTGIPTGVQSGCWHGGATVAVTAGRVRSGVDVRLARGGAVSGRLLNANGTPAAFASVDAESSDDDGGDGDFEEGSSAQTDAHGYYTVRGLVPGGYDICFDAATAGGSDVQTCSSTTPNVKAGRTVTGVNGKLPLVSAIEVTVTDTGGNPVAGVDAVAYSSCVDDCDQQPLFSPTAGVSTDASQATDSTGTALLDGITSDDYAVCLYAFNGTTALGGSPTGYADRCSGTTFSEHVDPGQKVSVSLTLSPSGAVSGTVTGAGGSPLAGVRALVSDSAGTDYADDDGGFSFGADEGDMSSPEDFGYTADDGTFTAIGVQPGSQTVCFDASEADTATSAAGYQDQCVGTAPGTTTGGTTFTVTAQNTTTGVTASLTAAAGISGVVRHGSAGVVGVQVIVFDQRRVRDVVGSVFTGAGGTFVVGRLSPGDVTVCFYSRSLHSQCYKRVAWNPVVDPPLNNATLVPVTAGMLTPGVDATLT